MCTMQRLEGKLRIEKTRCRNKQLSTKHAVLGKGCLRVFLPRGYTGTSLAFLHIPHLHLCFLLLWESFLPTGWGPLAPSRLPGGAAPGGFGAGGVQGAQGYSPVCRVCLPPESTPRGRVPVGVRPLRVSTLSLSSLQGNSSTSYTH